MKTYIYVRCSRRSGVFFIGALSSDGNSIEGWLLDRHVTLQRQDRARTQNPAKQPDAPQPPAAALTATAAAGESAEVLSRALAKLAGTSQRLLKYACTETIERAYYTEPPSRKLGAHALSQAPAPSCEGKEFSRDAKLGLDVEDRLRLAVAMASNGQIQSWASASRFDSRPVGEIIPEGPVTTAASGGTLVDIFENTGATYRFIGRKRDGAKEIFEFAFEVPLAASHSRVTAGPVRITTSYHGSFDVDAATAELVRLKTETDLLPPETKACRFKTDADYHYVQIGDGQFLMPMRSGFDVLNPDGNETRSVTTFSNCHEYAAESSVVFSEDAPAIDAKVAPKAAAALPPGLFLTVALLEPIDLRSAAAGDAVASKVTKAVRGPASNRILVDAGAVLHGRITAMQHRYSTSEFAYAIRYETLEQRDSISPVAVELVSELKAEQRAGNGLARHGSEFSLHTPAAPGDAGSWFLAPAATGGYVAPAGLESKWITVGR